LTDQLPSAIDSERALLGAVLLGKDFIHELSANVAVDDFLMSDHRHIYAAMQELVAVGKPLDSIFLASALRGKVKGASFDPVRTYQRGPDETLPPAAHGNGAREVQSQTDPEKPRSGFALDHGRR
jgi:hypothetical protein